MKTLSEYEQEWDAIRKKDKDLGVQRYETRIGIACDNCGTELIGEKSLLMSSPPQQNIRCPKCEWTGRRFV